MIVEQTAIADVLIIQPHIFADHRGSFLETFQQQRYVDAGIDVNFVQDNHSRSTRNVLRGLHYQLRSPQAKLITVISGEVYDVAVDLRTGSPTFGEWAGTHLTGENHLQIYIPAGFAHGFCVLSETADLLYKCSSYYRADDEYGVAWSDVDIGIDWPVTNPTLSEKDAHLPRLGSIDPAHLPKHEQR